MNNLLPPPDLVAMMFDEIPTLSISAPPVFVNLPVCPMLPLIVETPTTLKLFVSNVPSTLKPSIRVCALFAHQRID